jgi:hypothetical protein
MLDLSRSRHAVSDWALQQARLLALPLLASTTYSGVANADTEFTQTISSGPGINVQYNYPFRRPLVP